MASEKRPTTEKNFWSLRDNQFQKSVKEQTETSFSREYNGNTYHYEIADRFSGKIIRLMTWVTEEKNGKPGYDMFAIDLKDSNNERECLQMYMNCNATDSFMRRLLNIDLSQDVVIELNSYRKEKDGIKADKKTDVLTVYQGVDEKGERKKIEYFFDKNNNQSEFGELPGIKEIKKKGKPSAWDSTERVEFWSNLINIINAQILDRLKSEAGQVSKDEIRHLEKSAGTDNVMNNNDDNDDLPF